MNNDGMDLNINKHGYIHTLPSGRYNFPLASLESVFEKLLKRELIISQQYTGNSTSFPYLCLQP